MRINYKKRELLTKESEQNVELLVQTSALQLQSDILATKQEVTKAKVELEILKSTYPLDVKRIIDTTVVLENYEKGLEKLKELEEELGLNPDALL